MLTDSAKHFISRLTTANLTEMLWSLTYAVKEEFSHSPHAEFYCPESVLARWFEDEVNNLLIDQKLELIKDFCDQIKTNRNK
jgi:hypothetical protein